MENNNNFFAHQKLGNDQFGRKYKKAIEKAYIYAVKSHVNQWRNNGKMPYVIHPFNVYYLVLAEWGIHDINLLKACLCCDVNSDKEKLVEHIGKTSANYVLQARFDFQNFSDMEFITLEKYVDSFYRKNIQSLLLACANLTCNVSDLISFDNADRALKLWNRLNDLFGVAVSRQIDIQQLYGFNSMVRIKYTKTSLDEQLS